MVQFSAELAVTLDRLFMSRVMGKNINIAVTAQSFPFFSQQTSIETKEVLKLFVVFIASFNQYVKFCA